MKALLPGDSYKLWVDLAALFYDRIFKIGPMDVEAFDEAGNTVQALREPVLLLAAGASGRRTYGSQKHILPDERNVCVTRQMSLLRKIKLKERFSAGTHIDAPECLLFNAAKIIFTTNEPILAQTDGETVLIQAEDFPACVEMTEAVIPILRHQRPVR
jgi:diacylglycerol kinase family enzyme